METVFKKNDFILCDVPVPKGYPQSQTHCGIQITDNHFFLTTSPFPNPRRNKIEHYFWRLLEIISFGKIVHKNKPGEDYENPCLYVGLENNGLAYPYKFCLLNNGPLMDKPSDVYGLGSYCSDPDLLIVDDVFYILNRTSIRKQLEGNPKERYETQVHLIEGVYNGLSLEIRKISELFKEQDASPCLAFFNGVFHYFSLDTNSYNTGEQCQGLFLRKTENLNGIWSDKIKIDIKTKGFEPWHMSVFQYDGHLYAIIACVKNGEKYRCWQMLGEFSEDLLSVYIYSTPLTDYNSYRGTALVKDDLFILYNTTVNEKIKGGKSVDGREIVVSSMDFNELLSTLKRKEGNEN